MMKYNTLYNFQSATATYGGFSLIYSWKLCLGCCNLQIVLGDFRDLVIQNRKQIKQIDKLELQT